MFKVILEDQLGDLADRAFGGLELQKDLFTGAAFGHHAANGSDGAFNRGQTGIQCFAVVAVGHLLPSFDIFIPYPPGRGVYGYSIEHSVGLVKGVRGSFYRLR